MAFPYHTAPHDSNMYKYMVVRPGAHAAPSITLLTVLACRLTSTALHGSSLLCSIQVLA